jgi:hypothetical protein
MRSSEGLDLNTDLVLLTNLQLNFEGPWTWVTHPWGDMGYTFIRLSLPR